MKFLASSLLVFLASTSAFALVDMKNANYSESWTDIIAPGSGYDLRIQRTYNSRTLFNGIFGFGWCSDFESKLEINPEGSLKLTECGAGLELNYYPKNFDPRNVKKTISALMTEVRSKNKDLTEKYFTELEKDLRESSALRDALAKKLNVQGKAQDGTTYYSEGRINESIVLKGNYYERSVGDGTLERYDLEGRLTHMYDKNGNYLKLSYSGTQLTSVVDNNGRKLSFKYDQTSKKVSEVIGPNNLTSKYVIKGEDLVQATNAWKNVYKYSYDDLHNMTLAEFPDGTKKVLTYNKDKDWVTSYSNRKGCVESYDYQVDKEDSLNHYWSTVTKKCGDKVTNNSKYEFFHRDRQDGSGKYLYRAKSDVNGDLTDIVYHEVFGKPLSVVRNTSKVTYTYFDNGLVKTKVEPLRQMAYEYTNTCNKVSSVIVKYLEPPQPDKKGKLQASGKVMKTVKTDFMYEDKKCNLSFAKNSDGQTVKIKYDNRGRIAQIEDQSKKIVDIQYESRFGKPSVVTRPGLGTIQVSYKSDGQIQKVDSKEGPRVAVQVASIFNNLLDIIAPATAETPL